MIFLREKSVIVASKGCLQRIHLLCTFRHGSPPASLAPESVNIRVFLAAYMIAYYPAHVFETMGQMEQSLFDAATPLIVAFEAIADKIKSDSLFMNVGYELTKDFPTLLFRYLCHFKAWKVPDEAKLVSRIKTALLALYEAQAHLPPDEDPESKLNLEFRSQIGRLRSKLSQIAGEAELRKFDNGRVVHPPCEHPAELGTVWSRMTNEQLAHELLLDPEFQIDDGSENEGEVYKKIRQTFHSAFWASLVEDLKLAYPCYVRVLRVLEEVRAGLIDITLEGVQINKCIDMEDIKLRSNRGTFSMAEAYSLVEAMVVIIKRSQSPKRDPETARLFALLSREMYQTPGCPAVFCKGLEFLLDRLNVMRIDAANAKLRLIAPVIRDHGIDYERGKHQDRINAGQITLARTTAWLHDSMDAGESDLDGVVTRAVLNSVSTFDAKKCPETMMFDGDRVERFHREFSHIVSSMVAIIRVRHQGGEVGELSRMLADKVGVEKALEKPDIARQALDTNDAIYKLMGCRVRFQYSLVINGGAVNPAMVPPAVRCLFPLITQSATKIKRLVDVNKLVHGDTYATIIGEHVRKRKPTSLPRA